MVRRCFLVVSLGTLLAACGQQQTALQDSTSLLALSKVDAAALCAQPVTLAGKTTRLTSSATHPGVTEFALPDAGGPTGAAPAPDGSAWFTEEDGGRIARIAADGTLTEWSLPSSSPKPGAYIAGDSAGGIWFPERGDAALSHFDSSGQYRTCKLPFPAEPFSVAIDGNRVWFTDITSNHVGYMDVSNGAVRYWSTLSVLGQPSGIVVSGNGIWVSDYSSDALLQVSGDDQLSLRHLPSLGGAMGMAKVKDGSIWIAQSGSNQMVRIPPSGTAAAYSLGRAAQQPQSVAQAADASIWVTESKSDSLGKLRPDGSLAQTLAVGRWPDGIAVSDRRIWFTEYYGEAVGYVGS